MGCPCLNLTAAVVAEGTSPLEVVDNRLSEF